MQEVVGFHFPSCSVEPISLCEQGGISDWRRRCSCDDVELRVGCDKECEEGQGLLMREMAEETREETLSFHRIHEGDEWMRIATRIGVAQTG